MLIKTDPGVKEQVCQCDQKSPSAQHQSSTAASLWSRDTSAQHSMASKHLIL